MCPYQQTQSTRTWIERREVLPYALKMTQKRIDAARGVVTVMVEGSGVRRHLRVFSDAKGLFVLLGRRASRSKKYLAAMSGARVVEPATPTLVFYE